MTADLASHPNTGPCTVCQAPTARYGTGYPNQPAGPLCLDCQKKLTQLRKDLHRARMDRNR